LIALLATLVATCGFSLQHGLPETQVIVLNDGSRDGACNLNLSGAAPRRPCTVFDELTSGKPENVISSRARNFL
jgi:hypothetical protein